MKRMRIALGVVAAVGALALCGCAADTELSGLETQLAEVGGVNGAIVYTTHSGAPWNTQVQVMLFVDDPSGDAIAGVARDAVTVLAADPTASRNEVTMSFVDGRRAEYPDRFSAFRDQITIPAAVYAELGAGEGGGTKSLTLAPHDVRRLTDS